MKKSSTEKTGPPETKNDHRRYVNLSIKFNRWLLTPIGIWPKSSKVSAIEKYFNYLIHVVCYSMTIFLFLPCLILLIFEVKDTYDRIKLIGPLSFFMMAMTKYYLLIHHKGEILKCVERIERDWANITHENERNIMVANANYGRRLVIICMFFIYSSCIFYFILIPVSVGRLPAEDINSTFFPIPFPASTRIVDYRRSPINEIFFLLQSLAGNVMHVITVGSCGLAATFAAHACGQMEILMNWLKHLINGRAGMSETLEGRISSIVDRHVQILEFLTLTEEILQQISFVEFLGCITNLCLLGYYSIMEWNPKDVIFSLTYVILITSFSFNIFIFCYIGELVVEQCKKVGEVSYMIEWYRIPGNTKLCCILFIAMSDSSIKLTAGNMVELSISTFSDVVRTSVAFLNMLRATT